MGYCIFISETDLVVPAGLLDLAYVAVQELGCSDDAKNLKEAMDEWYYSGDYNDAGDWVLSHFEGEKSREEASLFAALGPFVEEGRYVEFIGEDGAKWRFYYDGFRMHEIVPTVTWKVPS